MNGALSILFSRLTWPSGLVRESAAAAIAGLLINPKFSKEVEAALLGWMKKQNLESVAPFGLLILYKSKILSPDAELPPIERLIDAISCPSVLSWMLLKEISIPEVAQPQWRDLHSGSPENDFSPGISFRRNLRKFLPPIYEERGKKIGEKHQIAFMNQWAYEWERLLKLRPNLSYIPYSQFAAHRDSDHYTVIDFQMSEIYRSSYLRALAWAIAANKLSPELALYLANITCPINLSLWKILPSRRPTWWPLCKSVEGGIDTVPTEVWKFVGDLWQAQGTQDEEWIIAEASGRIYEGKGLYDLEIFGVFQACRGNILPELGEIYDWYRKASAVIFPHFRLEGNVPYSSEASMSAEFGDWIVLPSAFRFYLAAYPRWQHPRINRGLWMPSPFLSDKQIQFECSTQALLCFDRNGILSEWRDFPLFVREQMSPDLYASTGQFLRIKKETIRSFEKKWKGNFCWICCLTYYHRKSDYEPYRTFCDYQEFGASRIIVERPPR